MKKFITIFGTRPEAIKMAPLVKELEKREGIESKICVTAQHREMLDQVLELFDIKPDFDLNIMKTKQSLTGITNRILEGLETIFKEEKPDMILVHGDTTTTFSSALAAYYQQIKVGHVEAGLRTFDKYFPFPEEMNRKLTGAIADLHFSPTKGAKNNLLREGIDEKSIYITGNTVIDAMLHTVEEDYVFENEDVSVDINIYTEDETNGYYYSGTGSFRKDDTRYATEKINVVPGEKYKVTTCIGSSSLIAYLAQWGNDGNWIGNADSFSANSGNAIDREYIVPEGVTKIAISSYSSVEPQLKKVTRKRYKSFYTKEEVDYLLEHFKLPDHIKAITFSVDGILLSKNENA